MSTQFRMSSKRNTQTCGYVCSMYGIPVQQAYKYFRVYSDDQRINKVFVSNTSCLEVP